MKHRALVSLFVLFALLPQGTFAATTDESREGALAFLNIALQDLFELKGSSQSEIKKETEVSLRKKILDQILDISEQDIQDIERSADTIKKAGAFTRPIRDAILKRTETFRAALGALRGDSEAARSVEALKDISKKILAERKRIENLGEDTAAIAAGFSNREVIGITKARFARIAFDVRKLEIFELIKLGSFTEALHTAALHIEKAKEAQRALEELVWNAFTVPEQQEPPAVSEGTSTPDASRGREELEPHEPPVLEERIDAVQIQELLALSLEEIKTTYLIFIDIARDIQTVMR